MTRRLSLSVLAGICAVTVVTACGSTRPDSPAATSAADSAATVSPPATEATTPTSALATSNDVSDVSEPAAETVASPGAITMTVGTTVFAATLADTPTARAFADRLPLTLDMLDVNGNEKAFELGEALPGVAVNPGTITTGDLLLYGSNTIVLFYESFDTPYGYSRIGQLNTPDGLAEILGAGEVTVRFARS